ncbi:DNA polymerase III subunit chi [Roseicyclus sp.]|uniref:DNA polymerase III subunit chi n=1 Tax=Roseicyclus sp. TaxID=1914329 RepID=UPI003F6B945A
MAEVFFYHLTQTTLEVTLRQLLEKSRAAGWRVAVRGQSDALLDQLDRALWAGPDDGFLPHGRDGGAHDGDQPVLLTLSHSAANQPDCVVSVEGATIAPEEIAGLKRAMVLFDGHDATALQTARAQWKALTGAGVKAKYWSEETGRWAMKAES